MLTAIALAQLLLAVALALWIAVWPAENTTGLAAQAFGTGLMLYALWRVALWGVPPRWAMGIVAMIWLAALARALWRLRDGAPIAPEGIVAWGAAVLGLILAGFGGFVTAQALASGRPPAGRVVDITAPLGAGRYLVAHGGRREITNIHLRTLNPEVPRFADWRGQSYALDFLGMGPLGLSRPLSVPADPARYPIFGAPVVAPCAGRVVAAQDDLPDMPVPEMDADRKLGNYVILACDGVWVVLAHLRAGSVRVAQGQEIDVGTWLGEVGNSGNSSEPHLHIHAQKPGRADAPLAGEPLPVRVQGRYLVRNDVLAVR